MIAAQLSGTGAGSASKVGSPAPESDAAREVGAADSGFADLLAPADNAATKPAVKTAEKPAAADRSGADDTAAAAEARDDSNLPDQLLALIGASPAPPVAPPSAGSPPPVQITLPPGLMRSLAGAIPAAEVPALPGATADAITGAIPTGANAAAGSTGAMALPLPLATTAETAAVPAADFAKALAQAATPEVGAEAILATIDATADAVDQGPLTTSTSTVAAPARAAAATPVAPALALPTDPDAGFDDAFGARIGWLAEQRIGRAEIRLSPEHLGAIEVRLQIDGSRVSAEFQSAHADVRHALENSVGRLRDMLGQQGLQLAHSDVGQGRGGETGNQSGTDRSDGAAENDGFIDRPLAPMRSRGLLDEYA